MSAPKENQNATKHGGAGALRQYSNGEPFSGLAAKRAEEVRKDYEANGAAPQIAAAAIMLQTIADLYMDAIFKASQDNNQATIDSYVKVFTWVQNSATRAWIEVSKQGKKIECNHPGYRIRCNQEGKR